jgi:hypothetical protein
MSLFKPSGRHSTAAIAADETPPTTMDDYPDAIVSGRKVRAATE